MTEVYMFISSVVRFSGKTLERDQKKPAQEGDRLKLMQEYYMNAS